MTKNYVVLLQKNQIIFRFSLFFISVLTESCDPKQYLGLFSTFSALILRNQEFSLTYNDCDTLLDKLGTLIKAVKSSGPN